MGCNSFLGLIYFICEVMPGFRYGDVPSTHGTGRCSGDVVYVDRQTGEFSVNEAIENIEGLSVPKGCYFVVGDNCEASSESRCWDDPFITENDIAAKYFSARNEHIEKATYN